MHVPVPTATRHPTVSSTCAALEAAADPQDDVSGFRCRGRCQRSLPLESSGPQMQQGATAFQNLDAEVVKAKAWDLDLGAWASVGIPSALKTSKPRSEGQEEPSLALLMLVRHGCLVESYGQAGVCWTSMLEKLGGIFLKQVPHDTRHAAEKFIAVPCQCGWLGVLGLGEVWSLLGAVPGKPVEDSCGT